MKLVPVLLSSEVNLEEFQTFLDAASEFKKFTPSSFLDCVNALEFVIKFSDSSEFLTSQRSCFALRKAS